MRQRGCGNFDATGQLWGCYSGKVRLVNPSREFIPTFLQRQLMCSFFSMSCSILGGSSEVFKLPQGALKWKLQWILSFFLAANYEWEDYLISLDFLVFAYINWMISGSRLGLWHPVMILNWRMISGGKTRLLYSHSVFFSFKWIYKYAEKLSWGISYHPNFTSVEWCPISA